jgi:hypothetical protein
VELGCSVGFELNRKNGVREGCNVLYYSVVTLKGKGSPTGVSDKGR